MEQDNYYDSTYFLSNDQFVEWVKSDKPISSCPWALLYHSDKDIAKEIDIARMIINQWPASGLHEPNGEKIKLEIKRILNDIEIPNSKNRTLNYWVYLKIAAIVLITVGIAWFLVHRNTSIDRYSYANKIKISALPLTEVIAVKEGVTSVILPDSSIVELTKGSRISYSPTMTFDSTRNIFLKGEAFFDVKKDPNHPFIVNTNDLITTVLGTSFLIKSYENEQNTMVLVRTGKVKVTSLLPSSSNSQSESSVIVLLPNQQVTFDKKASKLVRSLIENPLPVENIIFPDKQMVFEEAPVITVFELLKKQYGVSIICDEELLADCQLNAEFSNESLMEKIGMICTAIKAKYEIIDGQIIIKGSGCGSDTLK
tara:strand:- start:520 stop:1626 length:1107 start_codon:yes stop_codon:yes gene_type:complete